MVVPWNCSMDGTSGGAELHDIEARALISSPFVAAEPDSRR